MTTAREDTTRLAALLRTEQHALGEFLVALSVFHQERRWAELGYSGLFPFLTRELGLSNGAAQNRKTAAELILRFPPIEVALRTGKLCLSSVNELAKVITPENAADLLPRFYRKSARDAAFLAASIRPVENPPERFLVTPVRAVAAPPAASVAREDRPELHTCEVRGAQPATAPPSLAPAPSPRPTIKPLDAERARMNITVSRRLLEKLATARDALSHSHPGASEETILELGLDLVIERHRKRRGIGATPRKPRAKTAAQRADSAATPPEPAAMRAEAAATSPDAAARAPAPPKRSRHVPAHVWRAVWERDGGRCAWPLEGGGVCGSTRQLELDHVHGFALGAETTIDGCRLLCRSHQDVSARRLYGDDHMNEFTRPKGPSCGEPVAAWGGGAAASRSGLPLRCGERRRGSDSPREPPRASVSRSDLRPKAQALGVVAAASLRREETRVRSTTGTAPGERLPLGLAPEGASPRCCRSAAERGNAAPIHHGNRRGRASPARTCARRRKPSASRTPAR